MWGALSDEKSGMGQLYFLLYDTDRMQNRVLNNSKFSRERPCLCYLGTIWGHTDRPTDAHFQQLFYCCPSYFQRERVQNAVAER
jgi:hypothetical protein